MAKTKDCSWRKLISIEMGHRGDLWSNVSYCTITDAELDETFDSSYGCTEGKPFILWTTTRVYFPVQYDGSEWCKSVPRDPCDEKMFHLGGG
jgi:hypothetical protein